MLSKEQLQDASKCRQNDYCMINDRMCYMNEDGEVCDYPQIEKLAQSALELLEKIEQYETELLNLEHCVYDSESGMYLCPVCGGKELDGHFSDCRLGKLLKENNIAK